MSRQPIRIAQPPPPSNQQHHQQNHLSSSSSNSRYGELLLIAEQQRRLIDANRHTIQERETRGIRVDHAPVRLAILRNEVLCEEREMAQLKAIERSARETYEQRLSAQRQLAALRSTYTTKDQHLRAVISRITSLRVRLDVLYRRRLTAISAARDQQRLLSLQQPLGVGTATSRATQSNASNTVVKPNNSTYDDLVDSVVPTSISGTEFTHRPRASVEPFQVFRPKPIVGVPDEASSNQIVQQSAKKPEILSSHDRSNSESPIVIDIKTSRDMSPSPPKDPYPTDSDECLDVQPLNYSSNSILEKLTELLKVEGQNWQSDSEQSQLDNERQHRLSSVPEDGISMSDIRLPPVNGAGKLGAADQISIRADTLRAAKRRSWALQEAAALDETEYIRKVLCEEQKKGRTHLVLGRDLGNLFSSIHKPPAPVLSTDLEKQQQQQQQQQRSVVEEAQVDVTPASSVTITDTATVNDGLLNTADQLSNISIETDKLANDNDDDSSSANTTSVTNQSDEIVTKSEEVIGLPLKPVPDKGILRRSGTKKVKANVIFDPLALLLDAALEGEMDLVKTSAYRLSNISACNDEGITALHNAICAGHYEIVRFLVESLADVNAQDSDGWTPLHCAASCNNLPMVKLLVESGACIFAQTLSDLETPAEKCEADEDGYEGCRLYLEAAHLGAGVVNQQYMYAAYSYDAQLLDELSFPEGDRLRVIDKNADGQAWWLCESIMMDEDEQQQGQESINSQSRHQGLVPRNYLALYPPLPLRHKHFKMFELSQPPKTRSDNVETTAEVTNTIVQCDQAVPELST